MNKTHNWSKYCKNLYANQNIGLFLDFSDTGVTTVDLDKLKPKMQQAFEEMNNLEHGTIANPDENRQVGHYWLRNPDLAPTSLIRDQINQNIDDITIFADKILTGSITPPNSPRFTNILLIGIGGSALGPQLLSAALGTSGKMNIYFLDNTDPDGIDQTLHQLSNTISQTLVIVISKSGGTAETRNGMLETQHYFNLQGLDFSKQAVAITSTGSQLNELAKAEHWLATFPMWDWVGGRTSVTSAVGLLPLALQGVDIHAFLSGARLMDVQTRIRDLHGNPAALLASVWYIICAGAGQKDMVVLPYKDRLMLFSRYLQQLIMESLGKRLDLDGNLVQQGIAVYGNKGSTDQHAYVQQLRDGLNNFFVTFIEVLTDREGDSIQVDDQNSTGDFLFGFYKGTQAALKQNDRPSLTITLADLAPERIGALIALYERAVGLYAGLININAYHQPGVEAGKKAAGHVLKTKNRILDLLKTAEVRLSIQEICIRLDLIGEEVLVFTILRHYNANNELQIDGSFYDPENLKVGLG